MKDAIRAALVREAHRFIAEAADAGVSRIANPAPGANGSEPVVLSYPPGDGKTDDHLLTPTEASALAHFATSDAAMSGLRKLLREAASGSLFDLFCLLDGVADPQDWSGDVWVGADLVPAHDDEDRKMLHDDFLESYRDFVAQSF